MTIACNVLGLLAMAIDTTEGANLWAPLALTVIGGVVSSTILTLMVTPAFYTIAQDVRRYFKKGVNYKLIIQKLKPNNT